MTAPSAGAVAAFLVPALPRARVAWLRLLLAVFAVLDATLLTNHVLPHVHVPEFWRPTLLGRLLHLPAPTALTAGLALAAMVLGVLLVLVPRTRYLAGWLSSLGYLAWVLWSMGFGYVAHDHMAIVVAAVVLLTAGRADFDDLRPSRRAGWALRCVQVATVMTYCGSAVSKWVRSGTPWAWANGAVTVWAVTRRGSALGDWVGRFPQFLVVVQWVVLVFEFCAPVALWLRGRWLALAVGAVLLFHLSTYLTLGIHFLPTVVCWAAFLPLERLPRPRGVLTPAAARRDPSRAPAAG
ncbi:hypothetical protein [Kineococcus radiotolerans]|uniref:HTTM domain protein n=1 Tax=Kineococcus radiotolerans (strain ATCC BAA-149 / DSM 14245 / SRS30216) TaxID=266940 RepID=A6W6P4_KINRD|nr:hypothetical protein [Kineococcus radiotolerans]ABS02483.1 hypothetical protein Krad_0995 [Kineococcus radiotolerans SRS30216 = ATCC BAA-149]